MSQALIQYHRIHSSLLFLLICDFPLQLGETWLFSSTTHYSFVQIWITFKLVFIYIYIYIYILHIYIYTHTHICVCDLIEFKSSLIPIIMNVPFIKYMCYICFLPVQAFLLIFFQRSKCSHFNEV